MRGAQFSLKNLSQEGTECAPQARHPHIVVEKWRFHSRRPQKTALTKFNEK